MFSGSTRNTDAGGRIMDLGPKGKKAIVSGATRGMGPGRRIVNLLADNGFTKRVQR